MSKEPQFMQELHKIREKLSKKWLRMTNEEVVSSIKKEAGEARKQIEKLKEKRLRKAG